MNRSHLAQLAFAVLVGAGCITSATAGGTPASYRPAVEASYKEWFGRMPNQGELDYWTAVLASGQRTESSMRENHRAHLQQHEGDATIVRSYQEVFGRAPSEGELNFWRGQVRAGVSSQQMVQTHRQWLAQNARALVDAAYREWLGRSPNQGELDYWVPALANGQRTQASLLESHRNHLKQHERDDAIARSYREVFGRGPAEGELNFWRSQVQAGVSYARMVQAHREWQQAHPAPAQAAPAPVTAQTPAAPSTAAPVMTQAPKTIDYFGQLTLTHRPEDIQKILLTTADPLVNAEPLIGNAGAGLIGNAGAGLIGNAGAGLVGGSGGALTQVSPLTISIGRSFSLPAGGARGIQAVSDPRQTVTQAFQNTFGRAPSAQELQHWLEFKQKYPASTIAASAQSLEQTLRYVLWLPAGEVQRRGMVQAAMNSVFSRQPSNDEWAFWSQRIQREAMPYPALLSAVRAQASSTVTAAPAGRRTARRGAGG